MPNFRKYGASARYRARSASARSRRWGWPRRGIVTARSLLRYRSNRKRYYPTITYRGPSRENKISDSVQDLNLSEKASVAGGYSYHLATTHTVAQNRPTSISTGAGVDERIGNEIITTSLSLKMQFQAVGYIATGQTALHGPDMDTFRRTHFKWAVVEDLTMPNGSDGLPSWDTIYDPLPVVGSEPVNPLLYPRNINTVGRYRVIDEGSIVCDGDDPVKVVQRRIAYRCRIRYDGVEATASATNNCYLLCAAFVPVSTGSLASATEVLPKVMSAMRVVFKG